jgi:hypothetical protein
MWILVHIYYRLNATFIPVFSIYPIFFFFSFSGWGEPESTWYVGHCWPIVLAPDDRWWWLWSSWWNEDWQRKPKYSEKTCPSALCPPQIPHDLTWDRTRAAAVGSQRLTAWAMARPFVLSYYYEMFRPYTAIIRYTFPCQNCSTARQIAYHVLMRS